MFYLKQKSFCLWEVQKFPRKSRCFDDNDKDKIIFIFKESSLSCHQRLCNMAFSCKAWESSLSWNDFKTKGVIWDCRSAWENLIEFKTLCDLWNLRLFTTDGSENATDRRIHHERISSCKKLPIALNWLFIIFTFIFFFSKTMLNRCVEC